jgi:hypothetical protein
MNRTQWTLGGILLLQLLLILILRSPFSGSGSGSEPRPLLPVLEAISANKLQLLGPDDKRVTLVKEGTEWRVEEIGGYPADGRKIDGLLDDLQAIMVRRPVVSSGRYHDTFKVTEDGFESRVRVWDAGDDDPKIDLILGDSPNYRSIYARQSDEDQVYEIQGLAAFDVRAETSDWIEKDLVEPEQHQVVGLTVTNGSGSFALEKADGSWKVSSPGGDDARALDPSKIDAFLQTATAIRLTGAIGSVEEAHGFGSPAATVVLRWTADGQAGSEAQDLTLQIGGKVEDQDTQRYITRSGLEFTGTVWESSVTKLLEEKLDALFAS